MKIDKKYREEYLDDFAFICTGLMKDRMEETMSPEVLEILSRFKKLNKKKKK